MDGRKSKNMFFFKQKHLNIVKYVGKVLKNIPFTTVSIYYMYMNCNNAI